MIKTYKDYLIVEKMLKNDTTKLIIINGVKAHFLDVEMLLANVLCGLDNIKRIYCANRKIYINTIC